MKCAYLKQVIITSTGTIDGTVVECRNNWWDSWFTTTPTRNVICQCDLCIHFTLITTQRCPITARSAAMLPGRSLNMQIVPLLGPWRYINRISPLSIYPRAIGDLNAATVATNRGDISVHARNKMQAFEVISLHPSAKSHSLSFYYLPESYPIFVEGSRLISISSDSLSSIMAFQIS